MIEVSLQQRLTPASVQVHVADDPGLIEQVEQFGQRLLVPATAEILPEVLAYPVSDLGFDLYETMFETLNGLKLTGGLSLGLIDARNSTIEDTEEITATAKHILRTLKSKDIYISTNCDADFLTWEKAKEKIGVLVRVAENLRRDALW